MCLVCDGVFKASKLPGLVECTQCGFISADLNVSDEELAALYGEDYFHGEEYLDYIAEEESLRVNFRARVKTLRRLCPDLAAKDLFEIGCAYGFFLREIAGQVRSARGIDISAAGVKHARDELGLAAFHGDYLSFDVGEPVDLIMMWDTIEHLGRPDRFIEKAAKDIRSGGLIAITTGDIGSLNARFQGKNWRMIHPPTHMHYFSAATLQRLLERHGFDAVHVSHPGNSRSVKSILYILLSLKMKRPKIYATLYKIVPFLDMDVTVNLFDIMYVVARRR